jgi:hypothetical protein
MPTLGEDWELNDAGDVLFLMMYPDDKDKRNAARAKAKLDAIVQSVPADGQISISVADARSMLVAPDANTLREEQRERAKGGIVAGMVLIGMYVMDRFDLSPSINRAIWALRAYGKVTTYGDGSKFPTSESKIRECWGRFAPVAHLWGATRMNMEYPFAPERAVFQSAHFQTFLEVAAGIHRFATTFVPPRARPALPIVDPMTAWALPGDIQPRILKSELFPEHLVRLLKGYKAPQPLPP